MGRKAHVDPSTPIRATWLLLVVCTTAVTVGCGEIGERVDSVGSSPFTYDDRPLAERIEDHRAETQLAADARPTAEDPPDAFAFVDDVEIDESAESTGNAELLVPVALEGLILRAGPGRQHREILTIPADAVVATTNNTIGDWTHVDYGVHSGWVDVRLTTFAPLGAEVTLGSEPAQVVSDGRRWVVMGKVEGAGLNMRVDPDLESNIVGLLPHGAVVTEIGGPEGPWLNVEHDGYVGWVWGAYLAPEGAAVPESVDAGVDEAEDVDSDDADDE